LEGDILKKAAEYHEHARQCRELAVRAKTAEYKAALMQMAETWDDLARNRERLAKLVSSDAISSASVVTRTRN
jgi:transcription elongation GreA/GreB family factor